MSSDLIGVMGLGGFGNYTFRLHRFFFSCVTDRSVITVRSRLERLRDAVLTGDARVRLGPRITLVILLGVLVCPGIVPTSFCAAFLNPYR
jgi:hypothetical protein